MTVTKIETIHVAFSNEEIRKILADHINHKLNLSIGIEPGDIVFDIDDPNLAPDYEDTFTARCEVDQ